MKTIRALFWGCVTGAALAYLFAPRRVDLLRGAYGTAPRQAAGSTPSSGAAQTTPMTNATASGEAATNSGRSSTLSAANAQTATAENAAFIGNTHTRVYHSATDANLPNGENRAYFAAAEDAQAAGYRPAGQTTSV